MCFHKPRIDKTVEIILKNLDIYSDRLLVSLRYRIVVSIRKL